ncbi:leukocyte surface antigen CD47 isoform X2 [Grus americana]|uniref:leukocyte surface antigen CD47 isoform X2 n=1 Tax=Grus americana TaxID=9117 RepID=UPI0024077900|nr:leukocyte surface antigen CD47 isoform X2 [Grus americana]
MSTAPGTQFPSSLHGGVRKQGRASPPPRKRLQPISGGRTPPPPPPGAPPPVRSRPLVRPLRRPGPEAVGLPRRALPRRSAMWLLAAWVLLSAVGAGSAQLIFSGTNVVEKTDCNKTVILPCHVTNLKENNINVMFVTWKKQGNRIFSFDGAKQKFLRDPTVPSANLVSQADLPKGVASLMLNSAEADVGNYSCEVTESNREGETRIELRNGSVVSCGEEYTPTPKEKCGSWFLLAERAIIIALLFSVVVLCAAQFIVITLKYEIVPQKKVGIIVPVSIFTVAAVVGTVLFVQDGYSAQNQAGLGLIVVPAVIFVPLQYFIFGFVFDSLSQAMLALIVLHVLGYIIAVVGFGLCVSACPPLHGSVVIAGLAIMAIANSFSLAYVFVMGSRMKDHHRPGKAVEEPLNDAKGVMLE